MRKFREGDVGGRLVHASTGSSPTAPEVIAFLRDALLVPVYEGYGCTETGMVRSRARPGPPARPRAAALAGASGAPSLRVLQARVGAAAGRAVGVCCEDPCHRALDGGCARGKEPCSARDLKPPAMQEACCLEKEASPAIKPCGSPYPARAVSVLALARGRRADQHGLGDEQRQRAGLEAGRRARAGLLHVRPFPRGELLVKTRTMMKGYYKHPKARRLGEPDADRVARLPQWWQGDRGTERTGLASAVLAPGSGEPGCCGSAASPLRTRVSCSGRARARARAAPLMGPQR